VLESLKSVVGRLHFGAEGGAYVVVDDKRICNNIDIPQTNDENTDQQIVIVEIIQAPTFKTLAQGKITRILGDYKAPPSAPKCRRPTTLLRLSSTSTTSESPRSSSILAKRLHKARLPEF
jgi:hypothetical protein